MRPQIELGLLIFAGALPLGGCLVGTAVGAAGAVVATGVGVGAKLVGTTVEVAADGVGAAGRAVTGSGKKPNSRPPPSVRPPHRSVTPVEPRAPD